MTAAECEPAPVMLPSRFKRRPTRSVTESASPVAHVQVLSGMRRRTRHQPDIEYPPDYIEPHPNVIESSVFT